MTPSPEVRAATALIVYLVGLALTFGVRTWRHHRQTGDTGFRPVTAETSVAGRRGVLLFAAALALGVLGPLLAWIVPSSTLRMSAGTWWFGLALALAGLVLVMASQQAMGASWRIGVDPAERTGLVTDGPFAIVRNPIFSAMALAMTGILIMAPNAASLVALVALIIGMELQVRFVEEPYLLTVHGAAFIDYAARAGRFIPFVGRGPGMVRSSELGPSPESTHD